MFYNGCETLTYNSLFNFIVGNRGSGKTFWSKEWAISDFLKNGNQFIYLRRYKQELKKIKTFFNDISFKFPNVEFKVDKNMFLINGVVAGYTMPLSTSKIEKSVSFPEVNKIIFDEFIIDKGVYRYLTDEVTNFLEFYETIARMRDVRVFFLSNAITITNPYFLYFNLEIPTSKKLIKKNGDILIQLVQNKEFIEHKKNTRFGKLIEGTDYAKYSIENEFLRDNKDFISKPPSKSRYLFTLVVKGDSFGVYLDSAGGVCYVSTSIDPSYKLIYTTHLENHKPNIMLLKNKSGSTVFKYFIDCFKNGCCYFDSIQTKNIVIGAIKHTY